MISKFKMYYLILLLSFSISFSAQTKQEKIFNKINKTNTTRGGLPKNIEPSLQYNNAEVLVESAIQKLVVGDVISADKTIRESIELYPTMKVFDYVKQLCLLPDLSQANTIMNILYAKVYSLDNSIEMQEYYPNTYKNGVAIKGIRSYDKTRALFNFADKIVQMNKEFATRKIYIKSLEMAIAVPVVPMTNVAIDIGGEYERHFMMNFELAIAQKDYEKAIKINKDRDHGYFKSTTLLNNLKLIPLYLEKGDYKEALALNNLLKDKYILPLKHLNSFKINALQGNSDIALEDLKKSSYVEGQNSTPEIHYYLAIIDINKENYENALKNLNFSLNIRLENFSPYASDMNVDKYKVYKLMGDAYKGLKRYDKAKDFYYLSLLIDPDYQLAVSAMANLESLVATTISTDKNPPTILIMEPAVNRGLEIVSAGNDILVKGIAADPSGLKSVTINGISVYSQKDGNFWGNIPLNKDLNKITVVATDEAGNIAEHLFEIMKSNKEIPTDVIVATEKEGKSYCLLIGAQNYEDSSIPSLDNPIQDAVRLKLILKKDYGFNDSNVLTLFNPTANEVTRQLLELSAKMQPEDNLLIFYAGHGIWVEKEKKGYWLLTDAKRNDPNTWLQNKEVLDLIAKLPSRSTLLITDACFSGGVFKTRSIGKDAPEVIKSMNEKISRVAITSGNDTEVPDESIFMRYLVKALSENKEKYVTAQKMFINQIMEAVMKETNTEPRYGTLELAGHVGGDYVFTKKQKGREITLNK